VRRTVPIVHEKLVRLDRYPEYAGFFFHDVTPDPKLLDGRVLAAAEEALAGLEPFDIEAIDKALRSLAESLELKPGKAFQPIRARSPSTNVRPVCSSRSSCSGARRRWSGCALRASSPEIERKSGAGRRVEPMRAMILEAQRQPLRLADIPEPVPGPEQILIKVSACRRLPHRPAHSRRRI